MHFTQINTKSIEGRLLIAAIGKLMVFNSNDPDGTLDELFKIQDLIYATDPLPVSPDGCCRSLPSLNQDLASVINRHGVDNQLATSDLILADFIENTLTQLEKVKNNGNI